MARKRASMREGPLAELFRKTEAAQRSKDAPAVEEPAQAREISEEDARRSQAALEETVEHVHDFAEPEPPAPTPIRAAEPVAAATPTPVAPPAPESPEPELPVPEYPEPDVPTEAAASRASARYFQTILEPAPRLHRVPPPKGAAYIAAIRVIGVGGAGLNALHRMMDAGIAQVDFIAVNTDLQALAVSDAPVKISIGEGVTHGLGSGACPRSGRVS
jgi:cell division protein FtsZ